MKLAAILGAATLASLGAAALAQAPSAGDAIKARQTHYKEIGGAAKGLHDELAKPAPDVKALQGYAARISAFAPQIITWFPKGTGPDSGLKTSARAEIWAKPAEFKKAVEDFSAEAGRFNAVAKTGDVAAIRAENMKLGATCKSCHEQFRARD